MVNLGKEIENDKKWNAEKKLGPELILTLLGPCMNECLNFDPYITLDLFHPKQRLEKRSNIKEIETWKGANRLWNGKMIKKWPDQCWKRTQFYGVRTKRMQIKSYVIWTNEIPTILHLFWAKRETGKIGAV